MLSLISSHPPPTCQGIMDETLRLKAQRCIISGPNDVYPLKKPASDEVRFNTWGSLIFIAFDVG